MSSARLRLAHGASRPASWALALLLLAMTPLLSDPVGAQQRTTGLRGVIRDASTSRPVAGAVIALLGTRWTTASDAEGRFQFADLPADLLRVRVRHLGYAQLERSVMLREGRMEELTLGLVPLAPELPEVVVEAAPDEQGGMAGFESRRRMGMGTFFGFEDLRRQERQRLPDLVSRVAGVRVTPRGVAFSARRNCQLLVILDGQVLVGSNVSLWDLPALGGYAGIEVYPGPASLPSQFRVLGSECGVLVLWSRRGADPPVQADPRAA